MKSISSSIGIIIEIDVDVEDEVEGAAIGKERGLEKRPPLEINIFSTTLFM